MPDLPLDSKQEFPSAVSNTEGNTVLRQNGGFFV